MTSSANIEKAFQIVLKLARESVTREYEGCGGSPELETKLAAIKTAKHFVETILGDD